MASYNPLKKLTFSVLRKAAETAKKIEIQKKLEGGVFVSHGGTGPPDKLRPLTHFGTLAAAARSAKTAQRGIPLVTTGILKTKNPIKMIDSGRAHRTVVEIAEDIDKAQPVPFLANYIRQIKKTKGEEEAVKDLVFILQKKGHDAIQYVNEVEDLKTPSFISLFEGQYEPKMSFLPRFWRNQE